MLFSVATVCLKRLGEAVNFKYALRRSLFVLACPAFLLGPQSSAFADQGDSATRAMANKNLLPMVTVQLTTIDRLMILGALGDVSVDSLKVVRSNALKNYPDGKLPKTSVVKEQFFFAGKATGVYISSYFPFQINFKGHIWKYDASLAFDKNVQSLQNLLTHPQKVSGVWRLIEPNAAAELESTATIDGALSGAGSGAVTGFNTGARAGMIAAATLAVVICGVAVFSSGGAVLPLLASSLLFMSEWVFGGAVVGTVAGATAGALKGGIQGNEEGKSLHATQVAGLLNGDFTMSCDGNEVRISSTKSTNDRTAIVVRRIPPPDPRLVNPHRLILYDSDGQRADPKYLSKHDEKILSDNLLDCKSQADADAVSARFRQASRTLAALTAAPDQQATSQKPQTAVQ